MVKASQALSGEIVLDRLIETLMTLALEHAGAARGFLLLLEGSTPTIGAEAKLDDKAVTVALRHDVVPSAEMPEAVLRTVIRTRQNLFWTIRWPKIPFSADPYVSPMVSARSFLPLLKQAETIGLLYLDGATWPRMPSHPGRTTSPADCSPPEPANFPWQMPIFM